MTDTPSGSVTIADLYQAIMAMRAEVNTALSRLVLVESHSTDAERTQSDHESRLRTLENAIPSSLEVRIMALEKFRWQVLGALVAINGLGVLVEWLIWSPRK